MEESIKQKIADKLGKLKNSLKTKMEDNFDKNVKDLEKQLVKVPDTAVIRMRSV